MGMEEFIEMRHELMTGQMDMEHLLEWERENRTAWQNFCARSGSNICNPYTSSFSTWSLYAMHLSLLAI